MTQPAEPPAPLPAPTPEPSIQVYNPSGQLVSIPSTQLPDAQAQGYSIAPATMPSAPLGFDTLKAGARGALRGATAGVADSIEAVGENLVGKVLSKVGVSNGLLGAGDRYAAESKRLETEHPTASAVGEGVGMVGGTLAGEGLIAQGGALATGAGRGLAAISRTGELASNLVGRAGAGLAATGALGRAAVAGAELGARGAVEQGLYEGVKNLNEQMLGDPALNAEKIFAAAADGAEGGAIFGGVLGAGGSLVKSGARGLASVAQDVASKNADKLTSLADEQRWRALDPLQKFTKQANARMQGGTKGVGEVLGRYGITGNSIEDVARGGGIDEIGSKLDVAVEQVGQKLGALTGASTAVVPFSRINDALESVIAPLRKVGGREGVVNALESYRTSLASKLVPETAELATKRGAALSQEEFQAMNQATDAAMAKPITIQDAIFQRKGLDQIIYDEAKSLDPGATVAFKRDFRAKFEGLIVDAFDDAAKAAGNPNAKAELLGLKRDYQALSLAQDAAESSTSRMQTNRNLSLSDYMAGGTGSHIGATIGSVFGPAGSAIGSAVGGAAGAAVNRFGREKGNALLAAGADRLAAFGGKARMLESAEGSLAKEGLSALVKKEETKAAPAASAVTAAEERAVMPERAPEPPPPVPEAPNLPPRPEFGFHEPAPERPGMGEAPKHPGYPEEPVYKAPEAPKAGPFSQDEFNDRINDAIAHVSKAGRFDGMPPMSKLRAEFPELSREQFDAAILGARDSHAIDVKVADSIKHLPKDQLDGLIRVQEKWHAEGVGSDARVTRNLAYAVANKEPTGQPWKRAFDPAALEADAKGAHERALEAYDEHISSIEDAHQAEAKAWRNQNKGLDAEHGAKSAEWDARKAAAEQAHAEAVMRWEAETARAHAEHAAMLEKASEFARAQQAIKTVDVAVEKAAKGLADGAPKPSASSKPKMRTSAPYRDAPRTETPLVTEYKKARKEVDAIMANPAALAAKAGAPARHLPKISDSLAATVLRAATFMTGATPPAMGTGGLGLKLPDRASDADMHAFLEKYNVAKDPMSALRSFARGSITPNKAATLQIVSPELFKELQVKALAQVIDRQAAGKPMTFEARQRLSLLLDIPTDPSQKPSMAAALQSNLAPVGPDPDAAGAPPGPPPPRSKPLNLPDAAKLSGYDSLEQR